MPAREAFPEFDQADLPLVDAEPFVRAALAQAETEHGPDSLQVAGRLAQLARVLLSIGARTGGQGQAIAAGRDAAPSGARGQLSWHTMTPSRSRPSPATRQVRRRSIRSSTFMPRYVLQSHSRTFDLARGRLEGTPVGALFELEV